MDPVATRGTEIVVGRYRATELCDINLLDERTPWELAIDQQAFGRERIVVAFADVTGRLVSMAHAPRMTPRVVGLEACADQRVDGLGVYAMVFCHEDVEDGPPPADLGDRMLVAEAVAQGHGLELLDWFDCGDDLYRSWRIALAGLADTDS